MKRITGEANPSKWYHIESLRRIFTTFREREFDHENERGDNTFHFLEFKRSFRRRLFIMNPKTKRYKEVTAESLTEVGFY